MNSAAPSVESSPRLAWTIVIGVSALASALLFWIIYFKPQPAGGEEMLLFLPALNCLLNAASATCLVFGVLAIRQRRETIHKRWMIAAFVCSTVFLVSYILHHHLHGDAHFPRPHPLRLPYLAILLSHVLLSIIALPLILMTFFSSLSGRLTLHRRLAKFTFPIWLYVSVTGVVVFLLLKGAGG